jgi:chromosome segregation ATPase
VAQAEAEAAAQAAQRAQQDELDRVNAELLAAQEATIAQRRESELALAQARRRVDELEAQREAVASGHAQELEAARADARQRSSDLDIVKSEQRRALARLEKRVTELTAALSHSEETSATARESLMVQLSQRERKLADVEAQLESVSRESQRRLQEQEGTLEQTRRRLQAAEREAEAAQLASRDKAAPAADADLAEMARLKEALEAVRAQAATEEGKLRRARDEAEGRLLERDALFEAERGEFALQQRNFEAREAGLRTEVDEAHAERQRAASDWADRLRQRQERLATLEKEHAAASAELRGRIVGLTQTLLEAQAEALAAGQAAARDKAAALTGLQNELTRTQAELQSAQSRVAELEASALASRDELTRAEREQAGRAGERVAMQEAAHMAAMEQVRAQTQRLQEELTQARALRESAATAFAEKLAEKQQAMEKQQAQHEGVVVSLRKRVAELESEINVVRRQLAVAASAAEDARPAELQAAALAREDLQRQFDKAREQLAVAELERSAPSEEAVGRVRTLEQQLAELTALQETERAEEVARRQAAISERDQLRMLLEDRTSEWQDAAHRRQQELLQRQTMLDEAVATRDAALAQLEGLRVEMATLRCQLERATRERSEAVERDAAQTRVAPDALEAHAQEVQELRQRLKEQETLLGGARLDLEQASSHALMRLREREALHAADRGEMELTLRAARTELQALQVELRAAQRARDALAGELQDVQREARDQAAQANERLRALDARLAEASEAAAEERRQRARLQQEVATAAAAGDAAGEASRRQLGFTRTIDELQDKLRERDVTIAALRDEKAALAQELAMLRDRLSGSADERAVDNRDASSKVASLQEQLKQSEAERIRLASEFTLEVQAAATRAADALASVEDDRSAQEAETQRLRVELLALRQTQTEMRGAQARREEELQEALREAEGRAERAVAAMQSAVEDAEVGRDEALAGRRRAEAELDLAEAALAQLRSAASADQGALLEATDRRVAMLQQQLEEAREARIEATRAAGERMAAQMARLENLAEAQRSAAADLRTQLAETNRLCDKLRADKERLLTELADAHGAGTLQLGREHSAPGVVEQQQQLQRELRQLSREAAEQRQACTQSEARARELEALLTAARGDADAARGEAAAAAGRLRREMARLADEREAVASRFQARLDEQEHRLEAVLKEKQALAVRVQQLETALAEAEAGQRRAIKERERLAAAANQDELGAAARLNAEQRAAAAEAQSARGRADVDALRAELGSKEARIDVLASQQKSLQAAVEEARLAGLQHVAALEARMHAAEDAAQQAESTRAAQMEEGRERLADRQRQLEALRADVERLRAELDSKQVEADRLRAEAAHTGREGQLGAQLQTLNADNKALRDELQAARQDHMMHVPQRQARRSHSGFDGSGPQAFETVQEDRLVGRTPTSPATAANNVGGQETKAMVLDSRVQQLQGELDKALRERQNAAEDFERRMAQMNARLEESNNARSRLSAQLQAMAEAGRRRPLSEADGGSAGLMPPYRAKGGLVGAGVGSGGDSGMSMADETPVTSSGGDLKKNKGGLSYGSNGQSPALGRGSDAELGMNGGSHSPTLLIEKQMALDSRNRQLELELEKALAARQRAAEEFQQRLQAMRRHLDESEAERRKFAQQLRLITVDGLLGNGDEGYDLKNLNGKTHLLPNRRSELGSYSLSEATTREYDLY